MIDIIASYIDRVKVNIIVLLIFSFSFMQAMKFVSNENWYLVLSSLAIGSMCTLVLYVYHEIFYIAIKLIKRLKQMKRTKNNSGTTL
jgi:hypothetical protein